MKYLLPFLLFFYGCHSEAPYSIVIVKTHGSEEVKKIKAETDLLAFAEGAQWFYIAKKVESDRRLDLLPKSVSYSVLDESGNNVRLSISQPQADSIEAKMQDEILGGNTRRKK